MADNLTLNSGSGGAALATDDIAAVHYQRQKLILGADGTNDGDLALANPMPLLDDLAIARGVEATITLQAVTGINTDIDTAADEDIWEAPTTSWVAPTVARLHDLVSTSTADTSAGTGARTVLVEGLDSSGDAQSETVTMNGTTDVPTVNTYTMVHRLTVLTVGSGGVNAGVITATAQSDLTVTAQIAIGNNRSQMAIYKVPASKTGYLRRVWGCRGSGSGGDGDLQLWAQDTGSDKPFYLVANFGGLLSGGPIERVLTPPLSFAALTTLKLRSTASADDTIVSAGFDLVVVG